MVLWFCFLKNFACTSRENLNQACSILPLYQGNILNFINTIRTPTHNILKAKKQQTSITFYMSCMIAWMLQMRILCFDFLHQSWFLHQGSYSVPISFQPPWLALFWVKHAKIIDAGTNKISPQVLSLIARLNTLQANYSSIQKKMLIFQDPHCCKDTTIPTPRISKKPPK